MGVVVAAGCVGAGAVGVGGVGAGEVAIEMARKAKDETSRINGIMRARVIMILDLVFSHKYAPTVIKPRRSDIPI